MKGVIIELLFVVPVSIWEIRLARLNRYEKLYVFSFLPTHQLNFPPMLGLGPTLAVSMLPASS